MVTLGIAISWIATVGLASVVAYKSGNFDGKQDGMVTLENTVDALEYHYCNALEQQNLRISSLLDMNKLLYNQLQNTVAFPEKTTKYSPHTFNVTAYTLRKEECGKAPNHQDYGVTASGEKVAEWYTAAAPKSIPFGTVLYIPYFKDKPNKGIFVVRDRGSAITEGHLDIYMEEYSEALKFGRQDLEVYVLF